MATAEVSNFARHTEGTQARYPVNLRFTIPFYPYPLFVTLIIGREKRGMERLRDERARHPLHTWGNLAALAMTWTVSSVAALFTVLVFSAL